MSSMPNSVPEDDVQFGDLLRAARITKGMSQATLAELARLSGNAVSALERGARRAPRRESVASLARALALDPAESMRLESAAQRARHRRPRETPSPPTNVPRQASPFLGRQSEIAAVMRLLQPGRVATVVGAGGIGKTRTALEVARLCASKFSDGIWFVDLSALNDPAHVLPTLAGILDVAVDGKRDLLAVVTARLRRGQMLIILDSCEHLLAEAARIASQLAQAASSVRVLTTSRERLAVSSETIFHLPALALPPDGTPFEEMRQYDGVELFIERARAAVWGFELTQSNASLIVDTCRRLEGIALAIELAAARLTTLGLDELHARLDDQLMILRDRRRDVAPRQRALAATIAWSYDLLDDPERLLLRRLSIFPGRWKLDAAVGVCADDAFPEALIVLTVSSLAEKSLVATEPHKKSMHYRLLDATRSFAQEKLAAAGEYPQLALRHARWVADVADRAEAQLEAIPVLEWVEAYDRLIESARAAVEWALGPGDDPVLAARILSGLRYTWIRKSPLELRSTAQQVLLRLSGDAHPGLTARLYRSLLQVLSGKSFSAVAPRAAAAFERAGDRIGLGTLHYLAGFRSLEMGQIDDADEAFRMGMNALLDARHDTWVYSSLIIGSAIVAVERGDTTKARALLNDVVARSKQVNNENLKGYVEVVRAAGLFADGDALGAHHLLADVLERGYFASENRSGELSLYLLLAGVRLALHEYSQAIAAAQSAANIARDNHPYSLFCALYHWAAGLAISGDPVLAARMLGALEAAAHREGWRGDSVVKKSEQLLREAMLQHTGDPTVRDALIQGRRLTEDDFLG